MRRGLPGHARAAALRRRAGGRAGQGLLPDRHRPLRGAASDQRGARWPWSSRSRSPSCSAAAAASSPRCDRGADRPRARRDVRARRALVAPAEQVRQPARRRALRRRADRRAHQRRATARAPGTFWSAETCKGPCSDNTIADRRAGRSVGSDSLAPARHRRRARCPTIRRAPHCNTRGLTDARPVPRAPDDATST